MAKNQKIEVKGSEITIYKGEDDDYLSLTDIARYKDASNMDTIIQNWLRNRNTIELLGFWEQMYNPNFKPLEFEGEIPDSSAFAMRLPCKLLLQTNTLSISLD